MNRLAVALAHALLAVGAACSQPPPPVFGGPCEDGLDCAADAECVAVDREGSFCFPRVAREETECEDVDDCFDEGFPVDARCVDTLCACEPVDCFEPEVFVDTRCACLASAGSPCQRDGDCASGGCDSNGFCDASAGEPCFSDTECVSGVCNDTTGTCQ